jgi:acyl carrier protein
VKALSQHALIDRVIEWIRKNAHSDGSAELTADTNLLETGLLDSFGFVDLIVFIENQTGSKIDLMDVDVGEFSVVRGLCEVAMRNHQNLESASTS